ncbi:MAG: VOC family protein [Caulobacteraceae bacterium]|nr:VOC family protein [Caulobacteraceae bacterium]
MSTVTGLVPILLVSDVPRCAAFFTQKLGFTTDFLHGEPVFYGAVSRDGVVIHMRHVDEPPFAAAAAKEEQLICASFSVTDAKALYEEFAARGVAFAHPLTTQPWGGTDFHVRDPDGNVVSFVTYGV